VFQVVGIAIAGRHADRRRGGARDLLRMSRYGYHLDPKVYLIDRLPIEVRMLEVLLVSGITMAISVIATVVPASAASALRPVEGLRYD